MNPRRRRIAKARRQSRQFALSSQLAIACALDNEVGKLFDIIQEEAARLGDDYCEDCCKYAAQFRAWSDAWDRVCKPLENVNVRATALETLRRSAAARAAAKQALKGAGLWADWPGGVNIVSGLNAPGESVRLDDRKMVNF